MRDVFKRESEREETVSWRLLTAGWLGWRWRELAEEKARKILSNVLVNKLVVSLSFLLSFLGSVPDFFFGLIWEKKKRPEKEKKKDESQKRRKERGQETPDKKKRRFISRIGVCPTDLIWLQVSEWLWLWLNGGCLWGVKKKEEEREKDGSCCLWEEPELLLVTYY